MTSTMDPKFRVLHTRPVRPDGIDKVTGHADYAADIHLPRMLFARIKKSPYAHAIIKKIDVSKALALPGVEAVVTSADFPDVDDTMVPGMVPIPRKFLIGNFVAVDKVLYWGQAVAAVAATSPHIAEDALDLIEVEYEVLPPVMSAQQAMEPGAPILHAGLKTAEPMGSPADANPGPTNVASHLQVSMGDAEQAFGASDIVFEDEFHTGTWHQGYIEPHSATATWNQDGSLVIYSSSQGVFQVVRDQMATIMRMPAGRIRAVPMEIGGGFGGKNRVYVEPLAAMLSKKAGKPVKLSMTREEVMAASGPTSGTYIRAKIGAMKDGTINAIKLWMAYEAGAFPGSNVSGGANSVLGAYDIPNVLIDGYDVVLNKPRNAAYRAPGVPAPNFVAETMIDRVAEALDMDPMDVRLKNAARDGTRRPNGTVLPVNGNIEVMEAVKASPHYRSELTGANRGRGVAMGFWNANAGAHSINASVNADGTIALNSAAVDIGGLRATEAMTMAEFLGVPYEDVRTRILDTDSIGYTTITAGSGTGAGTSASVYKVALQIRERAIERAAKIWEAKVDEVTYDVATTILSGPADKDGKPRSMTFKQLAAQQGATGGYISGHVDLSGATGGPTYGGHIVDVEVDPDTGKVTVLRYTVVEDVGFALHPSYVEGQLQGAAAQGIGMGLLEDYFYDKEGTLRNSSLLDYRMPTTLDMPNIETILVEVPNPGHPLGVRGVGECSIVPPVGAIANALFDAIGIRMNDMPATPQRILDALLEKQGK